MDAQAWFALFGGSSLLLTVGIAIGVSKSRGKDIEEHDHKLRNLDNWRLNILPTQYVQHVELKGIKESLERIERYQEALSQRFMSGGAGA